MADPIERQGPLHALGRDRFQTPNGAVTLEDRSLIGKLVLRGDPKDKAFLAAAKQVLGFALPRKPNRAVTGGNERVALWTGPSEWLITCASNDESALTPALHGGGLTITPVTDGRAALRLAGPRAADVLRKGTSLDVHPRRFGPGQCAQTRLAQAGVLLHRLDEPGGYDIFCERSLAEYLWLWLEDAAQEFAAGAAL